MKKKQEGTKLVAKEKENVLFILEMKLFFSAVKSLIKPSKPILLPRKRKWGGGERKDSINVKRCCSTAF